MWRSNLLIRYTKQALPLIRNRVISKPQPLIQSSSPHFPSIHPINPRFFSSNPNPDDQIPIFNDTQISFPQEIDPHLSNFDLASQEPDPHVFHFESETPPEILDEHNNNLLQDNDVIEDKKNGLDQVFEEMPEREVELDMEKVEKVLSLLQSSLDGSLESKLNGLNLYVNDLFMIEVLETPFVPGNSLIRFYKWATEKPEFKLSSGVVHSLVKAVGDAGKAREVFVVLDLIKEIGEDLNVLNTEILNELILAFWKVGKGKAAREVFDKFEDFVCETNADSYYLTIKALCRLSSYYWACDVCEKMISVGKLPDKKKIGEIVSLLCKGDRAKDAHLVYLAAKEKDIGCPRPIVCFLISSLCKVDDTVKLALETLNDISEDYRKYAIKPFSNVVFSLCRMKELEEAKKLLFKMMDEGPIPGNAVFNYLITGFSKAGELNEAMKLVEVLESRGLRPDVYTYSVIMSGYVKGGEMDEALKVLSVAKSTHSKLCPAMFHTLIRGYCKLEEFEKAVELLKEMKESGVEPNIDEYDKMIHSLCLKALDWRTAGTLLEEMKEKGLHAKGNIKSLIRSVKELEEEELGQEEISIEA